MKDYTHEWLCRQIVDGIQDAIIFSDREGLIRMWNSGAENIFGYSAAEATGQILDLIIPEKLRFGIGKATARSWRADRHGYGGELLAVPAMRRTAPHRSSSSAHRSHAGSSEKVLGSAAILRDVTARRQKEKELNDRLTALENRK